MHHLLLVWSATGSEWETRYALQVEMNQQLDMLAILLAEKIEQAKREFKNGLCGC